MMFSYYLQMDCFKFWCFTFILFNTLSSTQRMQNNWYGCYNHLPNFIMYLYLCVNVWLLIRAWEVLHGPSLSHPKTLIVVNITKYTAPPIGEYDLTDCSVVFLKSFFKQYFISKMVERQSWLPRVSSTLQCSANIQTLINKKIIFISQILNPHPLIYSLTTLLWRLSQYMHMEMKEAMSIPLFILGEWESSQHLFLAKATISKTFIAYINKLGTFWHNW